MYRVQLKTITRRSLIHHYCGAWLFMVGEGLKEKKKRSWMEREGKKIERQNSWQHIPSYSKLRKRKLLTKEITRNFSDILFVS